LSPLEIIGVSLFIIVLFLGLFSIIFGLPGTILIAADVIIYAIVTGFHPIGWKVILIMIVLAVLAEALEFFIGMSVALQFGLSVKGFWASIFGSVIGATLLTPFFLGFGAIAGAFLGGFAGVFTVEMIRQRQMKPAFRAGYGMILGRIAGICTKGTLAFVMVVISLTTIYS
jgi:uncharacterized protein YqgC (DUF456 family)